MAFEIYRSSAGSGKTYILTKKYLTLLLTCPVYKGKHISEYFKYILTITFTNDAANEMKERIISRIKSFAFSYEKEKEIDGMLKEIYEETQRKISLKELIRRSKDIYYSVLHHYSGLNIGTIDAFMHKIVQSFKKELHLPYHFEISMTQSSLLEESTDRLLESLSKKTNSEIRNIYCLFYKK